MLPLSGGRHRSRPTGKRLNASTTARLGLNGLNFFHAAAQTGFGPFIAVYLTERGWSQTEIGVALSIGTASGVLSQLPSGMLVDLVHRKRGITAERLFGEKEILLP